MSGTASVVRRLRTGARRGHVDTRHPDGLRLILRELLFDGGAIPGWRRAAACVSADPEIFHPLHTFAGQAITEQAKQICAGCPVQLACLADAQTWEGPGERHGILGGLTAAERADLAAHADPTGAREVA